jgi:hypothetical protein
MEALRKRGASESGRSLPRMVRRDLIEDTWRENGSDNWRVDLTGQTDRDWTDRFCAIRDYVMMLRSREGQHYVQIVFDKDTITLHDVPPEDEGRLKLEISEMVAAANGDN